MSIEDYARLPDASPKATGLVWLAAQSAKVPDAFVWRGAGGPPSPIDLADLDSSVTWAVRSAAPAEDGNTHSHAGQFETVLSVFGHAELAASAKRVQASTNSVRAGAYREETASASGGPMDVIIQRMIVPRLSGVAFSRNPLTGLNEIVIEAVEGLGEQLVGEGRTPLRWIWRGGRFSVTPDDTKWTSIIEKVASEVARLSKAYRRPADLEWAFNGDLWWLQIRPITALDNVRVYSNRISREVMPGMIKPLVWSINVPVVNGAWIRLIERAVGPSGLEPYDLARQFAFRSYFNMTALGRVFELLGFPHDSLEILLGLPNTPRPTFVFSAATLRVLPRLLGLGVHLLGYQKYFLRELRAVRRDFATLTVPSVVSQSDAQLLNHIDAVVDVVARAAELNIVAPLLANLYAAMLRRRVRRMGLDPAEIDIADVSAGTSEYDPVPELHRMATRYAGRISRDDAEFSAELEHFLEQFGHLSESGNDISVPTWREMPEKVVRMVELAGEKTPRKSPLRPYAELRAQVHGPARWTLDLLYQRARAFQVHREAISFTYTGGYGLLRPLSLELGRRLVGRRLIAEREDVMFVPIDDLRFALANGNSLAETVTQNRRAYEAARDTVMPDLIYGDAFTSLPPLSGQVTTLKGVGSARGQHRGRLRIVRTTEDFPSVERGDIIVIPYSDVGWTPIFGRAGAVVAEAGGMLSHSSIVAREYGIPCVVSATGAMQLPDRAEAIVDGTTGEVVLLGET